MNYLRIYLFILKGDHLSVEGFRDVFAARQAWVNNCEPTPDGGLLHMGYELPEDNESLRKTLQSSRGRVLATEPCRWSLPQSFKFSALSAGSLSLPNQTAPCPLYFFTDGFGYEITELPLPTTSNVNVPKYFQDWIGSFAIENPSAVGELQDQGIFSDLDFFKNYEKIQMALRTELENYRFNSKVQGVHNQDIVGIINCCPPWFQNRPVDTLPLTVRLANVFENYGIMKIGDICFLSTEKLLTLKNFGQTSLRDLHDAIKEGMRFSSLTPLKELVLENGRGPLIPTPTVTNPNLNDWISECSFSLPDSEKWFIQLDIGSDSDYLRRRESIRQELLLKIDKFRFEKLLPDTNPHDPFEIVEIAPQWVLQTKLSVLSVTTRLRTVFDRMGIQLVGELRTLSRSDLQKERGIGRKSLFDLSRALLHEIRIEGEQKQVSLVEDKTSLKEHVLKSISGLPDRAQEIMRSRLGLDRTETVTLEKVGELFKITRERIRQLEKIAVQRITYTESWDDRLRAKLATMLRNRVEPLYLELLEVEDDWFGGFSGATHSLVAIIERFGGDDFHVYEINENPLVSRTSLDSWKSLMREANEWLRTTALDGKYSKQSIYKHLADLCLLQGAEDLTGLLKVECFELLIFASASEGDKLVGIGRSADYFVKAILEEAPSPLHYSEVHRLCCDRSGRQVDIRRVANACQSLEDTFLYGRGIWGLRKHLSLSSDVAQLILETAEEVILCGEAEHQWHCSELLGEVEERLGELNFDHYTLDVILYSSELLTRLGRQVWVLKGGRAASTSDRAQIVDLILKGLVESGKPMPIKDCFERVRKVRGVRAAIQIHPGGDLIRISPNYFGLLVRDVPLSSEEISQLQDRFYILLNDLGHSLHLSEFTHHRKRLEVPDTVNDYTIFSLCQRDARFHRWHGNLLGLDRWGKPRRLNINRAFEEVKNKITLPMDIANIHQQMEDLLGRKIDRLTVSRLLSTSNCDYDIQSNKWRLNSNCAQDSTN